MTEEEMQRLAAIIVAAMESAKNHSKGRPKQAIERRAMAAFKKSGGVLTRSELIRATRISAASLDSFVGRLCEEGKATVYLERRGEGGFPATIIRLL
jgi:hypothetical protein